VSGRGESAFNNPLAANAHVAELLGAYALGALDAPESEIVERHLRSCGACRAELGDYDIVTVSLAYAAPVHPVPVRSRAALLHRVDAIGTDNADQLIALPHDRARRVSWLRRVPRLAWALSATAAVLLVALSVSSVVMRDRINEQQQQLAAAQHRENQTVDVLINQRYTTELTSSVTVPDAQGKLLVNLADNSAMLLVKFVPQPTTGAAYVVWLQVRDEYARVGVLEVQADGRGTLIVNPPDQLHRYDMLVVTLEVDPNVAAPSGPEILTGSITPRGSSLLRAAILP
jgi:anti-sigma factor RsiW